jgi:hypothetical protein
VPPGVSAYSIGDVDIQSTAWDGTGYAPAEWRQAALKAENATEQLPDPRTGKMVNVPQPQPLGGVVELLIKLSRESDL